MNKISQAATALIPTTFTQEISHPEHPSRPTASR